MTNALRVPLLMASYGRPLLYACKSGSTDVSRQNVVANCNCLTAALRLHKLEDIRSDDQIVDLRQVKLEDFRTILFALMFMLWLQVGGSLDVLRHSSGCLLLYQPSIESIEEVHKWEELKGLPYE